MNRNKDLDALLFQKNTELKQDLEKPPYSHIDITITSYSEISDGTPNKFPIKKVYTEQNCFQHQKNRILTQEEQIHQQNQLQVSNSILESMTPQRMNKLIDWSKYNVTPGDGKNIFPQVQGPSIEFSNENSLNFKQPQKLNINSDILLNKYIEIEERLKLLQAKHKDFSTLEALRGKNLQIASQKIVSQQEVIRSKDKIIDELNLEIKKRKDYDIQIKDLLKEIEQKDQILSEFENKQDKDRIIENQEQQIQILTNRLKKEFEYRKQNENMLSEIKLKEIKRSTVFELNTKCQSCSLSKQELKNILQECSIEDDKNIFESEMSVPIQIREVVTLLLTKQREQIDIAFQQYEEQLKELSDQIEYFKEQNKNLIDDNNKLHNQLSIILNERGEQEQKLYEEFEKVKKINYQLIQENSEFKQQLKSPRNQDHQKSIDLENLGHFKSIQTDRSGLNNEMAQIKQQFQNQIKDLLGKISEQEKQILQLKNDSFKNLSSSKKNKNFQSQNLQNEMKHQEQKLKEKDKKNIELYSQIKQLQQVQKDYELTIFELKDELEKQKKKLQQKNTEVKQLIDQNKTFQDKNTNLNQKIILLQQQCIQQESDMKLNDTKLSPNNKSIEQDRVISQYISSNLSQQQLNQLVDEYKSYQQEFVDLKQVFTEKLRQHEILQNRISRLQQDNNYLAQQNQKLMMENQSQKDDKLTKRTSEEITTGVRCSAATGDSINIKSFIQLGDEESLKRKQLNILDLIQPELMSTEETLYILKEILIRSVKSIELIKKIYQISEIKELLFIIQQVDEKYQSSNKKLTKVISCILGEKRKIKYTNRSEKPDFYNS
ncbi:unnamed protein product (macronuclear) [Paramecium tetraurelia]|uniref:GRIP domain-containing protein n=1 Tax=Paramecium tetraurelia TaxID=5888 RepID=A0BJX6_PARTE|nr:uncharacterized protein GSPATT00029473001 [Paramecium tetraurelia]CAK58843.1 unnamed protein product [Paramecium tetraurelia]|eukprot:XP_001426241.1 hypothetical protein (macronuclear) [Paramecium tetraurelia strain d4-2]